MPRTGSVLDILFIGAIIVSIVLMATFSQVIIDEFQSAQNNTGIHPRAMDQAEAAIGVFDAGAVLIIASMYVVAIILAWLIPTSPLFFVPALIFLILSTWVSAEFSNLWYAVVNVGGTVTAASNQFPLAAEALKNLPFIQFAFGVLIMIVQFTRIGGRQRGAAPR